MLSMRKYIFIISIVAIFTACGSGDSGNKKETDKKETPVSDISDNPDYKAGLALLSKSDCLTCHKIDEKLTGPPYREVANKYAGMPDTIITHLANKIMKGGNGVWGEVMMLPHPAISQADAETMVKYILLLKQ
jgi:cytochrome c